MISDNRVDILPRNFNNNVPYVLLGGDKHGRNVAVLFSERVTKETAQNIANFVVDKNAVRNHLGDIL